eukprot:6276928-Prymnesium_polylepis.1
MNVIARATWRACKCGRATSMLSPHVLPEERSLPAKPAILGHLHGGEDFGDHVSRQEHKKGWLATPEDEDVPEPTEAGRGLYQVTSQRGRQQLGGEDVFLGFLLKD